MNNNFKRISFIFTLCLIFMSHTVFAASSNIFKNEECGFSIGFPTTWLFLYDAETKRNVMALNKQGPMALDLSIVQISKTTLPDFDNPKADIFFTNLVVKISKDLKMNLESMDKREVAGKKAVLITLKNDREYCHYYIFSHEENLYKLAFISELKLRNEGIETLNNILSTLNFSPSQNLTAY